MVWLIRQTKLSDTEDLKIKVTGRRRKQRDVGSHSYCLFVLKSIRKTQPGVEDEELVET
jgi:hypothetical protein